jgi:hypothetical protein
MPPQAPQARRWRSSTSALAAAALLCLAADAPPPAAMPPLRPPPRRAVTSGAAAATAAAAAADGGGEPPLRVTLAVRTFAGDAERFSSVLLPSLLAFVDWRACAVVLVLDDDDASRAWAPALAAALPRARVVFAPEPPPGVLDAAPYASMRGHGSTSRYAERGYTRQLYDTFRLDELLWPPADGDGNSAGDGDGGAGFHNAEPRADVVAVIDTDAQLYTVFPPRPLFASAAALRRRGLPVVAKLGDFWGGGDERLLREPMRVDSMGTELMPELVWRETFSQLRAHVAAAHSLLLFKEVWLRLYSQNDGGDDYWISPINALLNFGLAHDPGGYAFELFGDNETAPPLGSNRPVALHLAASCCATFGGLGGRCRQRSGSFPDFYNGVAAQLAELGDAEQRRMEAAAAPLCGARD